MGPCQRQRAGRDGGHLSAAHLDRPAEFGGLAFDVGPRFTDCQSHGSRARLGLRQQRHRLAGGRSCQAAYRRDWLAVGRGRAAPYHQDAPSADASRGNGACFRPRHLALCRPSEPDLVCISWRWTCTRLYLVAIAVAIMVLVPILSVVTLRSVGRRGGTKAYGDGGNGEARRPRTGMLFVSCAASKAYQSRQLAADLRRLRAILGSDSHKSAAHQMGNRLAYDKLLMQACEMLEIEHELATDSVGFEARHRADPSRGRAGGRRR